MKIIQIMEKSSDIFNLYVLKMSVISYLNLITSAQAVRDFTLPYKNLDLTLIALVHLLTIKFKVKCQ
jgi:hypothetical protein